MLAALIVSHQTEQWFPLHFFLISRKVILFSTRFQWTIHFYVSFRTVRMRFSFQFKCVCVCVASPSFQEFLSFFSIPNHNHKFLDRNVVLFVSIDWEHFYWFYVHLMLMCWQQINKFCAVMNHHFENNKSRSCCWLFLVPVPFLVVLGLFGIAFDFRWIDHFWMLAQV